MIRAVLDANVFASGAAGFLRPTSTPGELVRRWLAGRFELILSAAILSEVERTLRKPYFAEQASGELREALLSSARRIAPIVAITAHVRGVASHPEDDLVLATAVSARADYLVTGDKQLQRLGRYEGVIIVSPRAFLDVLEEIDPASPGIPVVIAPPE